ncbi:MAG: tetratricopeptide repeat protein, partial [Actinomycetota bacterium]|nr:tetratricopeptide repeat protein [Actinomycetota bacterium]
WYSLGVVHVLAEVRWDECLTILERALTCNPSHVAARARLAVPLACTGRPAEAAQAVELALRLSPRDPRASVWLPALAVSRYLLGDYEAAVAAARRSLASRPDWAPVHHPLAASLARLGRQSEAAEVFDRLVRLEPDALERMEHFARGFTDPAAGEHLLEGLRLAGTSR